MFEIRHYLVLALRKVYSKVKSPKKKSLLYDFKDQEAATYLQQLIETNEPIMIGRLGSVESSCMTAILEMEKGPKKYLDFIQKKTVAYGPNKALLDRAHTNAGIFPNSVETLKKFTQLMLNDIKELDVMGSWLISDDYFLNHNNKTKKIPLVDIEPYYNKSPWSSALKNKKVLVIHPFVESIKKQYENHQFLFSNTDILPKFNLTTIKAIQTIAGQKNEKFDDWFEALEHMKSEINKTDFDIAIIGCGAYGFPLAAHIKRIGKQAIHMGGATQILFGIKGARWDDHPIVSNFYNKYWSRPLENEKPKNASKVEDSCYW